MRTTKLIWLLLLLALPLHILRGQEQEESQWQFKGFLDTYHAIRTQKPNNLLSSRTRLRGEISKDFESSTLFTSFNLTHNALLKERTGFELREAYIDHREDHWGFRLGRQLVIWGVANGLCVTDLVSPMDMTEFLAQDYDDIRMPVNALRFFLFNDQIRLELLAVPTFEGYKLPTEPLNPWNIFGHTPLTSITWSEAESRPTLRFSNIEYGGRISFTLPGVDFSLSALHTWNKMPVITYQPTPTTLIASPHYYRMGSFGGDISKPLGAFVLRGETAFNTDKHFSYKPELGSTEQKGFSTVHYLVGVDWLAPNEWTMMIQFSSESILKYEPQIAQPQHQSLITIHLSKKLLESSLKLFDFTYFDINNKGWFSRFGADYSLNDYIHLSIGFDWFGGDKGIFGIYKQNSEIWAKAKYNF